MVGNIMAKCVAMEMDRGIAGRRKGTGSEGDMEAAAVTTLRRQKHTPYPALLSFVCWSHCFYPD